MSKPFLDEDDDPFSQTIRELDGILEATEAEPSTKNRYTLGTVLIVMALGFVMGVLFAAAIL